MNRKKTFFIEEKGRNLLDPDKIEYGTWLGNRQIAYEYGYPLIRLKQNCGFNEMNYQDYYIDITHPNTTNGRKRIIEVVKSGILSTIQ